MTFVQVVIDMLQTLAHHGEVSKTNIEFHPKQLRDILSALITQNRRIMDLEDELRKAQEK